ncbi:hypothetical protein L1F30_10530 [Simiduia sp. 21SJ11W-1]|uniref:hypothetical protein n=1 Tax=Simiduia sp. 21SJ11W-1 TaxID=2909669 RepID=UPI0020A07A38|nr:hypothetical protein [Simiduia sp. 21SJ11W-1]UTA46600.1 hypothetical protein L1F30_10530 [Simiduia sp. 21SJ11W-1]
MDTKHTAIKFYGIYLIVAVITIACLLMNGPMRGGLPLDTTVVERIAFISEHRGIWALSWFCWMLSALGLFVFCAILADELKASLARTVGLSFVGMGIAPDLIAEVIYAFVIPKIIAQSQDIPLIEALEIIAMHLTGYLGNGLYNLGGLVLTCAALAQGRLETWVAIWGISAWILGLLLSCAIAIGALGAAEFFTATAMVLSTSWMLIFAHRVLNK